MFVFVTVCAGTRELLWSGGGGQTSPEAQGIPYPKLKTPRIWPTTFLGETEIPVQKQTKIKMNDIDSPKLGGAPTASKLWGQIAQAAPPPPGSRVPVFVGCLTFEMLCFRYVYVTFRRANVNGRLLYIFCLLHTEMINSTSFASIERHWNVFLCPVCFCYC